MQRHALAHPFFLLEEPLQHDAGDEALRPVVEPVDVDDCDLMSLEVDAMRFRSISLSAPDQVAHAEPRRVEAALKRADRCVGDSAAPR